MNQQNNRETNDQSIFIEDLSAHNAEEIKGGPSGQGGGDGGDIIVFDIIDSYQPKSK